MTGFAHDLAGGQGNLIAGSFQSPGFQAGAQGWQVTRAGHAEFNDITIRGGQIVGGTALYYSGTPGPGTLVASIAAAAGTDAYGNPYPAGMGVESPNLAPLAGSLIGSLAAAYPNGHANLAVMALTAKESSGGNGVALLADGSGRSLSTTGAFGFGDIFNAASQRPLVVIPPSGDTTGAADSTAIFNAFASGWAVLLQPAQYYVNAPIVMPAGAILRGCGAGLYETTGTIITGAAGFAGAAMITMPTASQSQEIRDLCLDGTLMPAGTCAGIAPPSSPSHTVLSVKLENLAISGTGFSNAIGNINGGTTWRGRRIFVHSTNGTAFNIQNAPDSCWTDCASLGAGNHGWQPFGASNATFVACRAEFSTGNGFNLSGAWGTGNGSGGLQFTDCSTDRNTGYGVHVDATGTAPVTFSGLMTRRDGNGTGTAAVHVAAGATVVPVLLDAWQCFPGVDDNGGGTLTPANGLLVSGAVQYLSITNAYIHAATTGVSGMTALNNASWRCVATRTGSTSAPGAITLVADSA